MLIAVKELLRLTAEIRVAARATVENQIEIQALVETLEEAGVVEDGAFESSAKRIKQERGEEFIGVIDKAVEEKLEQILDGLS